MLQSIDQHGYETVTVDVESDKGIWGEPGDRPAGRHGSPAAQRRLSFDLNIHRKCRDKGAVDEVRNRHRIVDRRALPPEAILMEPDEVVEQFGDELADIAGATE